MNYTAMLIEIPTLVAEAEATRGTRPATPDGAHTRAVPGSRCLADLDRMIALSDDPNDGLGALAALVRVIIEEREEAGETDVVWPWDDVLSVCWWLADQLEFINGRELFAEYVDDVARLHANLRRICQVSEPKPVPCPVVGCDATIRVEPGAIIRCANGHDSGTATARRALITQADLARMTGRHRKQIERQAKAEGWDRLMVGREVAYRWSDAAALMEAA